MCAINSRGLPSSRQNPTKFWEEITARLSTVGPLLQAAAPFSPTQGTKKPKTYKNYETFINSHIWVFYNELFEKH